jgi:hypothetical protein
MTKILVKDISASLEFVFWLFLTLHNYYFYSIGLSVFSFVGTIGMILISSKNVMRIPVEIVLLAIMAFIWTIHGWNSAAYNFSGTSIVGILLGAFWLITYNRSLPKVSVMYALITLHVIFWLVQFSVYFLFDTFIDYLVVITGEESRVFGGILSEYPRCSGLFSEPANYGVYLFPIWLYLAGNGYKGWFLLLYPFTLILTLSITNLVFAFFAFFVLLKGNYRSLLFIVIMLSITLVIFYDSFNLDLLDRYIRSRMDFNNDGSFTERFGLSLGDSNDLGAARFMFGSGIGNYDLLYLSGITTVGSGLLFSIVHLGIIPSLIMLFLVAKYLNFNAIKIALFLLLLSSTMSLNYINFWYSLFLIGIYKTNYVRNYRIVQ